MSSGRLSDYSSRRYDKDSGQVYSEYMLSEPNGSSWMDPPAAFLKARKTLTRRGPPSLRDLSIRCFLENLTLLTPDSLATVPWKIGQVLWERLKPLHNNSFSIWRCFVLRYPEQLQAYASFSQIILENLLPQILLDLQSITPTMPHIVLLDISTSNVHLNALLGLSSIPTLTYLRLGSPIPGLIKAWAQQAQESDGFPHLRVLDMLSCDESLVYSLDRLERLPKLLLCRMFPARPHRDQEIPSTKCGPWIDLAKFDGYQKLPVEKPSNPKAHRQKWRRTRSELATIDARSSSKPCALRSVLEFTESLADLLPQKEPPFIHLVYRPCGFPQLSQSQLVASHIWFRLPSDQSRAPTVPKLPPHPPPNPPNAARQLREGRTRDLSEMLGSFGSGLT